MECPAVVVVDGDSLRCGAERLRLLGIDAPELGACPRDRQCVEGNGQAAKQSLAAGIRLGPFRYERVGVDRYGRTLVAAWAGSTNLACWQMRRSYAEYVAKWDNGGRVAKACR
ncbi:MAG: thermonuclease family protein [Pseudomonadota bacterium]|nr:thermonuclease family protein [Pseudomonadota bacterium]